LVKTNIWPTGNIGISGSSPVCSALKGVIMRNFLFVISVLVFVCLGCGPERMIKPSSVTYVDPKLGQNIVVIEFDEKSRYESWSIVEATYNNKKHVFLWNNNSHCQSLVKIDEFSLNKEQQ
jgi:hypothetical protein